MQPVTRFLLGALCAVALVSAVRTVWATPGAVDGKGCHQSGKIGLHCHPARAGARSESADQKRKRIAQECRQELDAGACKGYGRKKNMTTG